MINNRQAGRRRGRGGQRQPNGRIDNGNRIDNRARGNAPQLLEKYKTLARDAQQAGDRVLTEYYLQFADHYFRVLSETRARQEEAQGQQHQQRRDRYDGPDDSDESEDSIEGEDDDFGFRQPRIERPAQPPRAAAPDRQDRYQSDDRDERYQRDDRQPRADGVEDDTAERAPRRAYRDDAQRDQRDGGRDQPARDGNRDRRPARTFEPRRGVEGEPIGAADRLDAGVLPPSFVVDEGAALSSAEGEADAPAPRRRGRPRKVVTEAAAD